MSLPNLPFFPYPRLRPGQMELIHAVTRCVEAGQHLCIEAPNGLGKTIGVLSGVLSFLQQDNFSLIYVARTHKQLDRVMEELRSFSSSMGVSGVVVRGRYASCVNPLVARHKDGRAVSFICSQLKALGRCQYYQMFLNRLNADAGFFRSLYELPLTGMELRHKCLQEHVCPYEVSKLLLPHVAVVATTYHTLFDPDNLSVFLEAYNRPLSKTILVLDEAHNLPKIAVELASAKLSLHIIRRAASEAERYLFSSVYQFTSALEQVIRIHLRDASSLEILVNPYSFNKMLCNIARIADLSSFLEEMVNIGDEITRHLLKTEKLSPVSYVRLLARFFIHWCNSINREDTKYFIVTSRTNPDLVNLELVALDPRRITLPILNACWASIHLSGTLQPISAHIDLVGLPKSVETRILPSPFSQENMLCVISKGVTTALRYRSYDMFRKIGERIAEVCWATPHNVGVFVSSYTVLNALIDIKIEEMVNKKVFYERSNFSSSENDSLVRSFKDAADEGALLIGVLGGRNSEGEDYPGWEMESVVIIGVPFAQPNLREEARINYFESRFPGRGRKYGYILPAMRSAAQAAGRPVRRLTDKGAIVFLDDRYAASYCRSFLPRWITERMIELEDHSGLLFHNLSTFFSA